MKKDTNMSPETDVLDTNMSSEADGMQEEVQEIDYDLVSSGPLYFDPRNLKPGYIPCFVSNEPGQIEMYKRFGYNVVIDQFKVGHEAASSTTRFGSAVTVQSKCGALLVLMAISEELHKKLMAYRHSKNLERDRALGKIDGIPDHLQTLNGQPLGEYRVTKKH